MSNTPDSCDCSDLFVQYGSRLCEAFTQMKADTRHLCSGQKPQTLFHCEEAERTRTQEQREKKKKRSQPIHKSLK